VKNDKKVIEYFKENFFMCMIKHFLFGPMTMKEYIMKSLEFISSMCLWYFSYDCKSLSIQMWRDLPTLSLISTSFRMQSETNTKQFIIIEA